jgi:sirohydrochlorin cobaltochelatase
LEKILRQRFGKQIFVGVVQQYPDSSHLVDIIAARGFKQVSIIPFFLVAGYHFRRDIIGTGKDSWKSQLENKQLSVDAIEHGLGLLPGIEQIIIRHIEEARAKVLIT